MSQDTLTLNFDNTALRALPLDPETKNYVRKSIPNTCFSLVQPTPVKNPRLAAYSLEALRLLDTKDSDTKRDEFVEYFSGNKILPGSTPAAHLYCGHQFGYFSGQLGDGRAIYLGEVVNTKGERWELQLKGAGQTPYSRDADGRAVLRSSIREFLCSEAMYYLGVPTTRAGTLVVSSDTVVRDPNYSGRIIHETVAIVSRIAPTFIRFGSFEIFKPRDVATGRAGPSVTLEDPLLFKLLDYVIEYHFPEIKKSSESRSERYYLFLEEIVRKTARLAAYWQTVGFAHGVLNTDNMSILGLTLDYGPFGFLDEYNPGFICNGSDHEGRYSFKNQPEICKWNCLKLMEAISAALPPSKGRQAVALYDEEYNSFFHARMKNKLGLKKDHEGDKQLFDSLLKTLEDTGADMTNTFRSLSKIPIPKSNLKSNNQELLDYIMLQTSSVETLADRYKPKYPPKQLMMLASLAEKNPMMLQMLAGVSAETVMQELKNADRYSEALQADPTQKKKIDTDMWTKWIGSYQERLSKEVEGLDDDAIDLANQERVKLMNLSNPKFVLRNYMAQHAIELAEKDDFSEVHRLYKLLQKPYDEGEEFKEFNYDQTVPKSANKICVTCSS